MIALLRDEPAASRVEGAIEAGAVASWVNVGEALYVMARRHGAERAWDAISALAELIRAEEADADLTRAAAEIKAKGGLSYADCFAIATAARHGVPLLTGDPEILRRKQVEVVDLR